MANLDTTSKRRSSVQLLKPYTIAPPAPSGTIDQADRQHIAWTYSGILATALVVAAFPADRGFVLTKHDQLARGAEWRRALPSLVVFNTGSLVFSPPIPLTELDDPDFFFRTPAVLTGANFCRLTVNVISAWVGSSAAAQYSLDGGTVWAYLDGASGPVVDCSFGGTNVSAWTALEAAAQADVLLRIVSKDGFNSPVEWGNIAVEFSYVEG